MEEKVIKSLQRGNRIAVGAAAISSLTALEVGTHALSKGGKLVAGWASGLKNVPFFASAGKDIAGAAVGIGKGFAAAGTTAWGGITTAATSIGGMFGTSGTVAAATSGLSGMAAFQTGAAVVGSTLGASVLPLVAPAVLAVGILCAAVRLIKKAKLKNELFGKFSIRSAAKDMLAQQGITKPSRMEKKVMRAKMKQALKDSKHLRKVDKANGTNLTESHVANLLGKRITSSENTSSKAGKEVGVSGRTTTFSSGMSKL